MQTIVAGIMIVGFIAFLLMMFATFLVGPIFLMAFIADLIYSNFETKDGAPQMTFWMWVGIGFLVRLAFPMPTMTFKVNR